MKAPWNFLLKLNLCLIGITIIIIAALFLFKKTDEVCSKCNVILVSLDTLSALHLPCYGYKRDTAPNLCKFAGENILFTNSYSQSPTTLNSHFSIFTSLYPSTHKMTEILEGSLSEKYLTLAQILRMNGYHTIFHGPLTDDHLPLNRGLERGFSKIESGIGDTVDTWSSALEQVLENTRKNEPTFVFLHTYDVHDPYLTGHKEKHLFTDLPEYPNIALTRGEFHKLSPELYAFCSEFVLSKIQRAKYPESYNELFNSAKKTLELLGTTKDEKKATELFQSLPFKISYACIHDFNYFQIDKSDPNQIEYLEALYDEQIYRMDQDMQTLFEFMQDPEIAKNTILIITSDHGEEFFEHGTLTHGNNVYRTSTYVPLIMRIPGVSPQKITDQVQGIDIYPTIISLLGLEPKSKLEGIDLTGIIFNKSKKNTNKYLLSEYKKFVSIQMDDWRYYYNKNSGEFYELYNIKRDPDEKTNLIKEYPEKIDQIQEMFNYNEF